MDEYGELPKAVLKISKLKKFKKNDNIYKLQRDIKSCYYILSGRGKIYLDHKNGRRSILNFLGPNDWIGELSIFCVETEIKENKVLQDMECLEVDLDQLRDLCLKDAGVSFYFASYISNKLLMRTYRMSENSNYSLDKRLASFILEYEQDGNYTMAHTDVSEYLNVSYRHVLYVIKEFCERGLLEKNPNGGYRVLDRNELKNLED